MSESRAINLLADPTSSLLCKLVGKLVVEVIEVNRKKKRRWRVHLVSEPLQGWRRCRKSRS